MIKKGKTLLGQDSSMQDGLFGGDPSLPPEDKRVCQLCGRFFYEGHDTINDWLIGRRRYRQKHRTLHSEWVIRCPQHITEWALRSVGRGRSQFQLGLVEEAKERDGKRFIPVNPYSQPFPSSSTWSGYEENRVEEGSEVRQEP